MAFHKFFVEERIKIEVENDWNSTIKVSTKIESENKTSSIVNPLL